jgi:hypothetical protein
MVDFVVLHELGHFYELAQDPTGYQKVIDESKRSDGLGRAYFGFYNALMDIYVNTNTLNRAPVYGNSSGGFSREVQEMYREKLFTERDFSKLPLSKQFGFYLLNLGMGTHKDISLSPEARKAIDQGGTLFGSPLSCEEVINTYLRPAIGIRNTKEWQGTISQRKFIIDQVLRPAFEHLITLDLAQQKDPNEAFPGDLEGFEATPEDFEGAVREVLRQNKEANKTQEERDMEARAKAAEEIASRHMSPEEAKGFGETLTRVGKHASDLSLLFQSLRSTGGEYQRVEKGHFKTGPILDVTEAIGTWDKVSELPSEARVMKRLVYQTTTNTTPHEIRIWLVPDLSGSMENDITLVQDLAVTFSLALQTLSTGVKLGQHSLEGSLGVVGYNDTALSILPLKRGVALADIAQSYKYLIAAGGTSEHLALEEVARNVKRDPPNPDRVDILVSITDGETDDPVRSKALVKEFEELGVHLCAFKFTRGYVRPDVMPMPGSVSPFDQIPEREENRSEQSTFDSIWGKHGAYVRGAHGVLPAMKKALHDLIDAN